MRKRSRSTRFPRNGLAVGITTSGARVTKSYSLKNAEYVSACTEYMEDEVGYGYNRCYQSKARKWKSSGVIAVNAPTGSSMYHPAFPGYALTRFEYPVEFLLHMACVRSEYVKYPSVSTQVQTALAAARAECKPTIKPSINLLNFMRELKDVKRLFSSSLLSLDAKRLGQMKKYGKVHGPLVRGPVDYNSTKHRTRYFKLARERGYSKRDAKLFINSLSSDTLCWSFGWMPTLLDLIEISGVKGPGYIHDKMLAAKEIGDKSICYRIHGSSTITSILPNDPVTYMYDTNTFGYLTYKRTDASTVAEVKCFADYKWDVVDYDPLIDCLKQTQSELGLHCIAGTVWEALPWSFFIDYFLPIGKVFEEFDHTADYSPPLRFVGAMQSVKTTNACSIQSDLKRGEEGVGSCESITYSRENVTLAEIKTSWPWLTPGKGINSASRIVTSIALIGQFLTKRK